MYESLALFGGFILLYSTIAGRVERSWLSGPILFTAFGFAIGPEVLDLLSFETDRAMLRNLAELTLALVLFTDAASADLGVIRNRATIPIRLLLIGLPLTIGLGYWVADLLNVRLTALELMLVAVMLAPTDAALGKAVVSNEAVPEDMRQGLNLESGLNDGICVPFLFLFLALAQEVDLEGGPWSLALDLVLEEIGIGLAAGLVVTAIGVMLLRASTRHGWLTDSWGQIPVVALGCVCFAAAQLLGGSGFIAAFAGGLLFARLEQTQREKLLRAAEGTGDTLALVTWVIFGAAVVGYAAEGFEWRLGVYAIASLTLIRMLPVFFSLTGSGLRARDKLFVGWFGPRGLASVVFAVIVLDANLPNGARMATIVACTVILSILFHGMTANVWASTYAERDG